MEQIYPTRRTGLDPISIYDDLALPKAEAGLPYVAVNMVSSIDGKITLDRQHKTQKLGSSVDRDLMGRLRSHFDAVLRGAETVRASPYFPGVPEDLAERRAKAGEARQPMSVVVSGSLDLPLESPFFSGGSSKTVVLTTSSSAAGRRREVEKHAAVEPVGNERVDMEAALKILYNEYGVRRLLVEGGAALNYWFIQKGLLHTLFWTVAPKLSGFRDDLTMVEGPSLLDPVPQLHLESIYQHENELFLRWGLLAERRGSQGGR